MKTTFYYVCTKYDPLFAEENFDRFTASKSEALRIAKEQAKNAQEDTVVAVYLMTTAELPAKRLIEAALTQTTTRKGPLWLVGNLWSKAQLIADNADGILNDKPHKIKTHPNKPVVWTSDRVPKEATEEDDVDDITIRRK